MTQRSSTCIHVLIETASVRNPDPRLFRGERRVRKRCIGHVAWAGRGGAAGREGAGRREGRTARGGGGRGGGGGGGGRGRSGGREAVEGGGGRGDLIRDQFSHPLCSVPQWYVESTFTLHTTRAAFTVLIMSLCNCVTQRRLRPSLGAVTQRNHCETLPP